MVITEIQKKVDKNEKSSEKVKISGLILPKKKPLIPGKKKAAQIKTKDRKKRAEDSDYEPIKD